MEIVAQLAQNVRRLRLAKGWSQEELAAQAGVHRTFVSQIELMKKKSTIETVDKLAKGLGVRAGLLLDPPE